MATTQRVGIEAVFDISRFTQGLNGYISGLGRANSATTSASDSMSRAGGGANTFGGSLGTMGSIAGGVAVAGIAALAAGVTALGAVLVTSANEAAKFEQSIANIAAVAGSSIEGVGELKELALDLSLDPNLSVSANEAAAAIEVLAKNGVEIEDILAGVGRGVVVAGNAMGEDFSLAADVATDALNIFGISADDFISVADNLTGVMVNSKFGLNDMRLAISQGGAVAASAGIEFDEFAAIIAATSSNFGSGSDAGTAFKTFIQRLTAPTKKAKAQMEALGLEVFDAEGKMRSMTDIFTQFQSITDKKITEGFVIGGRTKKEEEQLAAYKKQLEGVIQETEEWEKNLSSAAISSTAEQRIQKMDRLAIETANVSAEIARLESIEGKTLSTTRKLTEKEKLRALTTIFGADAIRFATSAMSLEAGELENLRAAINKEGLAEDAAATRTETFQGAIERLSSAFGFLKIQLGTPFLSPLTNFFDNTITPGIRLIGQLAEGITDIQKGGVKLSKLAFDLGFDIETVGILNQISNAYKEGSEQGIEKVKSVVDEKFINIFSGLDFSEFGAKLSGIAFDIGFGVDTANAIYEVGNAFENGLFPALKATTDLINTLTLQGVSGGGIIAALGFSDDAIQSVIAFETELENFGNRVTSFFSEEPELGFFDAFRNLQIVDTFKSFAEALFAVRNDFITGTGVALSGIVDSVVAFAQTPAFEQGITFLTDGIATAIVEGITISIQQIPDLAVALSGLIEPLLRGTAAIFGLLAAVGAEIAVKVVTGFAEKITGTEIQTLTLTELTNLFRDVSNLTGEQLLTFGSELAAPLALGLVEGLSASVGIVVEGVTLFANSVIETFAEIVGIASPSSVFAEFGLNIVQGLAEGLINNAGLVVSALQTTIQQGLTSLGDAGLPDLGLSELFTGGDDDGATLFAGGDDGEGLTGLVNSIQEDLGEALTEASGTIEDLVTPAFEAVNNASTMFETSATSLAGSVSGQTSPALSRLGSILSSSVNSAMSNSTALTKSLTSAIDQLEKQLSSTNDFILQFADHWKQAGKAAKNTTTILKKLKNELSDIAALLLTINSNSAATGGAQGGAAVAAVGAGFQSFNNVRNSNTSTVFNLNVNSNQTSGGIIRDFEIMQALA